MRKIIVCLLLVSAFLLSGCMRHAGRNILELMLIKGERMPDGALHSRTYLFRRNGAVERNTMFRNPGNQPVSSTEERGTLSTDRFKRVAKTIEENDFFSKKEKTRAPDAPGQFTDLAVSSDEVSNDIEVDPNDPQIQNIIATIEKVADEIEWKPAK